MLNSLLRFQLSNNSSLFTRRNQVRSFFSSTQWAKQHDVIRPSNSSQFHLGNRAEAFIGKISQPAYRDPGKRACPHSHMNLSKILLTKYIRPLHMSPVNQAGPLIGTNFTLGSYEKFQPGCRNEKSSRRVVARNS